MIAKDDDLGAAFEQLTGRAPEGIWVAPGRVNLIGEHTDHNDGHVLPFAIGRRTRVAVTTRADGLVRCWSGGRGPVVAHVGRLRHVRGWAAYPCGTVWALREAGAAVGGLDIVIESDVPSGAGLSSSAALTVAVALAVNDLSGAGLDRLDLARAARRAETDVVGAPVGIMDQVASLFGRAGHAVFLDARSLDVRLVPLDLAGLRLLVLDTRTRHAHASGGYAERRRECAAAAAALGVPALRDATPDMLGTLDPLLARRARHVVTEEARVLAAVEVLRSGDPAALGPLLTASHASLRDDFAVSTPELDGAVAAALSAGALGARLTGGGFGGAVLALVPPERVDDVTAAVRSRAVVAGWPDPDTYEVTPSDGATRLPS